MNDNNGNQMTLHTSPGCTVPTAKWNESGNPETGDCGANSGHTGCGISYVILSVLHLPLPSLPCLSLPSSLRYLIVDFSDPDPNSYGQGFNNNQGGVWAMQWEDSGMTFVLSSSLSCSFSLSRPLSSTLIRSFRSLSTLLIYDRYLHMALDEKQHSPGHRKPPT